MPTFLVVIAIGFHIKMKKWFKLTAQLATHDEAEIICNNDTFDNTSSIPTLVTIKSADEQRSLQRLKRYLQIYPVFNIKAKNFNIA